MSSTLNYTSFSANLGIGNAAPLRSAALLLLYILYRYSRAQAVLRPARNPARNFSRLSHFSCSFRSSRLSLFPHFSGFSHFLRSSPFPCFFTAYSGIVPHFHLFTLSLIASRDRLFKYYQQTFATHNVPAFKRCPASIGNFGHYVARSCCLIFFMLSIGTGFSAEIILFCFLISPK